MRGAPALPKTRTMLVKFAVDPQALHKASNPLPIHFDRLIERWENFGVLVNAWEIEDKLDSIEFSIREQLEEIFKDDEPPLRYRFLEETVPQVNWETFDDDNIGMLSGWEEHFELAIIEETLAEIIGVGETGAPLSHEQRRDLCGEVEPIGLAIADQAWAWRRASAISRRGFEVGDAHETLWNERFSRLAEFSIQIVIIDAYALHDRQISGFIKLLQLIDRNGRSCHVTLFSSPSQNNDESVSKIRELLDKEVDRLSGVGVRQVTVRLFDLSDADTGKMLHDRRIRFDRSVYAPENSFALVFSGDEGTVPQSISCTLQLSEIYDDEHHPYKVMKERENKLLKKAQDLKWLPTEQDFMILYPVSRRS